MSMRVWDFLLTAPPFQKQRCSESDIEDLDENDAPRAEDHMTLLVGHSSQCLPSRPCFDSALLEREVKVLWPGIPDLNLFEGQ